MNINKYSQKLNKLKGTKITIFESFSQETIQIRKKMEGGTSYQKTR